jgi:hypothetical protein
MHNICQERPLKERVKKVLKEFQKWVDKCYAMHNIEEYYAPRKFVFVATARKTPNFMENGWAGKTNG